MNRSLMLAVACIVWSLTSMTTGTINSLTILAIMRFGLGIAQAATEPLIFSLASDSFSAKKLPFANSVIAAGPYIGSALSCLSVIAVSSIGWRGCFKSMGAIGVAVGMLSLLTIREPARDLYRTSDEADVDEEPEEEEAEGNPIKMLWNNPVALYAVLGSSFRFITMFAMDFFYPAFMLMAYSKYKNQYLALQALATASTGLISAISGGVMAEKFGKKNYAKICWWGSALAWPCCVIGLLTTSNFTLAITMLFGRYLLGENFWAPNLSMI
jgi:sugar phosphate permease